MLKFKEILDLCKQSGFLVGTTAKDLNLGPLGVLLSENLRNEWLYNNVHNNNTTVLLSTNKSISESYNYVKNICSGRIPFGLTHSFITNPMYKTDNINEVEEYFNQDEQIVLQTDVFVSPTASDQFFYKWQNQRRIWWRKISALPSRYALSDIQTDNENNQNVEIVVTYPWGSQILESIRLNPNSYCNLSTEQLQVKDGRKKVQAHIISNRTYLFPMVLNMLCDAYDDETRIENLQRPLLRFHRKIAPYKISFAITSKNAAITEELNELAQLLCLKLRKDNFSVLFTPNSYQNTLESQWTQYDQMGIPYNVVLNEGTLKNGILHLRNRDTTLKEQVHVSELQKYVGQLFKNY